MNTANIGKNDIPFGVVNANSLPELVDEIVNHGVSLFHEEEKKDVRHRIETAETVEEFMEIMVEYECDSYDHINNISELEEFKSVLDDSDLAEIISYTDYDGCHITYEKDGYKYELKDDLLFVIESPFIAHCRPCSPCCPNAGDLNTLTEENGGILAYFYDPDYCNDKIVINENEIFLPSAE